MADEKPQKSSDGKQNEEGSKRRYFRRRRRKNRSGDKRNEQTQSESRSSGKDTSSERKSSRSSKRRRSRRRSNRERQAQVETTPEVSQEPDPDYEEPSSVYVYTYIVRPAYRDSISDYRPESLFLQSSKESDTFQPIGMEHLKSEINAQLDLQFQVAPEEPSEE